MAAVSHLKNKKEAKVRESIEKVITKCTEGGGSVSVKQYIDVMSAAGVEVDTKDGGKLEKLSDEDGMIDRAEFLDYARKSSSMKEYMASERNRNIDKAEIAFKVNVKL